MYKHLKNNLYKCHFQTCELTLFEQRLATGAHTKETNKYTAVMIHDEVSVLYKSLYNLF